MVFLQRYFRKDVRPVRSKLPRFAVGICGRAVISPAFLGSIRRSNWSSSRSENDSPGRESELHAGASAPNQLPCREMFQNARVNVAFAVNGWGLSKNFGDLLRPWKRWLLRMVPFLVHGRRQLRRISKTVQAVTQTRTEVELLCE